MELENTQNGDWQSWRRYVVESLRDIRKIQENCDDTIAKLRVEIAVLKVKAGLIGSIVGVMTGATIILVDYFLNKR